MTNGVSRNIVTKNAMQESINNFAAEKTNSSRNVAATQTTVSAKDKIDSRGKIKNTASQTFILQASTPQSLAKHNIVKI